MSAKTLRNSLTLLLSAMILSGCANYSGLDPEGQRLDAASFKTAQSQLMQALGGGFQGETLTAANAFPASSHP